MHSTRHFTVDDNNGRYIWTANYREVNADNVAEVVTKYMDHSERKLTIYSGVHGDMAGRHNYPEREFAYEDRRGAPDNVKVINVHRKPIVVADIINQATTDVLFAWCFSNMSAGGASPYKF